MSAASSEAQNPRICRFSAIDQVRACHQSQDRDGARPRPCPSRSSPAPTKYRISEATSLLHLLTSAFGRLCCKSLFAPLIANFSSCRRGFRVNMWGTSSPGDKLTGDFGNEPDATSISDRGLFRLLAGNLSPGVFRLLQHNRHVAAQSLCGGMSAVGRRVRPWRLPASVKNPCHGPRRARCQTDRASSLPFGDLSRTRNNSPAVLLRTTGLPASAR